MEITASANYRESVLSGIDTQREVVRLGLVGASGFVGLRTTEILSADSRWKLIPIVRATSSLAVLARQNLEWRVSDFFSPSKLASALEGCSVCIHAAIGDAAQIVHMAEAIYRACALAGVSRLVWLSSASVHGQNPALGTNEETPLHDRHPIAYNNAKVKAEWALERLALNGAVEVVRIRPSIIFGPRSRWISDAWDDLQGGLAAWIDQGRGICNTLYIDNLVEFICSAAIHPRAPGQAFLVGDGEVVTWRDFLLPIANYLGFQDSIFTNVSEPIVVAECESALGALTRSPAYGAVSSKIPDLAKRVAKGVLKGWRVPSQPDSVWNVRKPKIPKMNLEMALLQQCRWPLSNEKARTLLGFKPSVLFSEGMENSLAWLDFRQ